ncbi:MAG TPA: hypothetical protein VM580_01960 [Labilithrix sp.]|nr:hypothetical protein [Labilithrix sp.]
MKHSVASGHVLVLVASVAGWIAACGSSGEPGAENGSSGSSSGGGNVFGGDDAGGENDSGPVQPLRIEPPILTVTVGGTLKAPTGGGDFRAYLGTDPAPVAARWSLDDVRYGDIDASGHFAGKPVGGKTKVRARVGTVDAVAEVEIKVEVSEDFANLSDEVKQKLRDGGSTDESFKWLYPYDRTVFPRGLPSPTLQFSGVAPAAFRVRLKSSRMEIEGFYPGGEGAARVTVAPEWWRAVTFGVDASESVDVEVTKIQGGAVTGPKKVSWRVAPGSLRGSIYYNSYNSKLAIEKVESSGAVLVLRPGKSLDVLLGSVTVPGDASDTKCVVCHSVSASGNRLVTGIGWNDQPPENENPIYSGSFALNGASATLIKADEEGRRYSFGALSPDGKWMVSNGVAGGVRGLTGTFPSKLIDVSKGTVVSEPFFSGDKSRNAVTPAFSPDGTRIAFNDGGDSTLAIATFDDKTDPPTIGNLETLITVIEPRIGWPTFTPDSKAVFAHVGTALDTENQNKADLVWIDLATKTPAPLDALNGRGPDGEYYLPYGQSGDGHMNYEPTMLPVAVGGYYWVVFTSRRSLGNTIYDGEYSVNSAGDKPFEKGEGVKKGVRKKLWVAAIDVNRVVGADISHPAFYLEGQELESGNMRGFWALDACKADGATCEGGDECCNGFCRNVEQSDGSVVAQCVPPPASCANETERCKVDADCCNAPSGTKCVNQACTTAAPSAPK